MNTTKWHQLTACRPLTLGSVPAAGTPSRSWTFCSSAARPAAFCFSRSSIRLRALLRLDSSMILLVSVSWALRPTAASAIPLQHIKVQSPAFRLAQCTRGGDKSMLHLRESTSCCFCCSAASSRPFFSCSSLCRGVGQVGNAACQHVPGKAVLYTPAGELTAGQALLPQACP